MKKIDVFIEARTSSTRLPKKVLKKILGKTCLELLVERCHAIRGINNIIIATTTNPLDDEIVKLAKKINIPFFRGDENDVLSRVTMAADHFKSDVFVEITGDNPLICPSLASDVIDAYKKYSNKFNFFTNDKNVPYGFNVRVFNYKLLKDVEKKAKHRLDREHVVNYIVQRPDKFKIYDVETPALIKSNKHLRFTMDTIDDFKLIEKIYEGLYSNAKFSSTDIVNFVNTHPEMTSINSKIQQKKYIY